MKVKISYNIDLDDIPDHISDLMNNVSEKLTALSNDAESTAMKIKTKSFPASTLLNTFGLLRGQLEKIDTLLTDFGSILAGYEKAKLSPDSLSHDPADVARAQ